MTESYQEKVQDLGARGLAALERVERVALASLAETKWLGADTGAIVLAPGVVHVGGASRRLGRLHVRGETAVPVGHDGIPSPEEAADAVEGHLREREFSSDSWILAIPKDWYVTRTATFPGAVTDADLPRVLRYEMDRLTPLSAESALFDFVVAERGETLSVSLIATSRERIAPYLDVLGKRGITITSVTPSLLGWACLAGAPPEGGTVVDLGPERPELLRVTGRGSGYIFASVDPPEPDPEAWLLSLGSPPEKIVWGGTGPRVDRRIAELGPAVELPQPETPGTLSVGYRQDRGPATALALGGLDSRKDLFRPDLLASEQVLQRTTRGLGLTALLAGLLLALIAAGNYLPVRDARARLAAVRAEIEAVKPQVDAVRTLEKRLADIEDEEKTLQRFKRSASAKLLVLRELSDTVPTNTWFNRLSVKDDAIEIAGYSDAATDLLGLLERSSFVEGVEFSSPTVRDRRRNADRFKIKARLENVPDGTP